MSFWNHPLSPFSWEKLGKQYYSLSVPFLPAETWMYCQSVTENWLFRLTNPVLVQIKMGHFTCLSYDTNEPVLKGAFEQHGEILEVKVICDHKSGKSKGYGFVQFTSETAATTALKEMDGQVISLYSDSLLVSKFAF
ncbi:Splicing factor-like protein [Trema orientale]|uniref:Splicing factor-like protein n=1 Tax=Trema orientale TaxID=63057 RepID=A0A2P5A9T6_TREOI|nr:Splicing factor-like protein [Trema orientale]